MVKQNYLLWKFTAGWHSAKPIDIAVWWSRLLTTFYRPQQTMNDWNVSNQTTCHKPRGAANNCTQQNSRFNSSRGKHDHFYSTYRTTHNRLACEIVSKSKNTCTRNIIIGQKSKAQVKHHQNETTAGSTMQVTNFWPVVSEFCVDTHTHTDVHRHKCQ